MPWCSRRPASSSSRSRAVPGVLTRRCAQLDLDDRRPIRTPYDNPLILANRKAKRLASLLRAAACDHQGQDPPALRRAGDLPFVDQPRPAGWKGSPKTATFQRGRPGTLDDPGIVGALANGITNRCDRRPSTSQQARAIARGLAEAGIRPSNKHRQVGDYRLGKLLAEGEGFQDWEAQHVSIDTVHRRVRIYTVATASSPEIRATRVRQARREFEILEGIDHPGILKVKDYKETELGPALIFDHDPKAVRLDHLLREQRQDLSITQRLQLVRDIAETLEVRALQAPLPPRPGAAEHPRPWHRQRCVAPAPDELADRRRATSVTPHRHTRSTARPAPSTSRTTSKTRG